MANLGYLKGAAMNQIGQGLAKRGLVFLRNNIPLLIYAIICIYQISYMNLEAGDYLGFRSELSQNGTVLATLGTRWATWSSRVLIDGVVYSLIYSTAIWRIITFASFILTFYSLHSLVKRRLGKASGWIVLVLLLCYPLIDMNGAGWYATLPNYFWPLSCALYVLLSCARDTGIIDGVHHFIPRWMHIIRVLVLALFAASMELLAAAMTGTLVLTLIWGASHARKPFLTASCLIASCAGVALVLLCPGNSIRLASEVQTWWPSFSSLGLVNKISLGLGSTMGEYLSGTRPLILVFAIILSASILEKRGVCLASLTSLILPFALILISEMLRRGLLVDSPLSALTLPNYGGEEMGRTLPAVSAIFIALIVFEGFLAYEASWKFVAFIGVGGLGLATRVAMGLSPTLFASGSRTFLFCDFALIGLSLMLLSDYVGRFSKTLKFLVLLSIAFCCSFCTVNTIESLWMLSI